MSEGLEIITAAQLGDTNFPPLRYIVPKFIAPGLTLFAGQPKVGKSWLALNFGVAVASGGCALQTLEVEQGQVLVLALEDNPRRLQSRLRQMIPRGDLPEDLHLVTECPSFDAGGLERIRRWCESASRPRLIVIDVFAKVRSAPRGGEPLYQADYRAMSPLKDLADEFDVGILAIHHCNKRENVDDPFEAVSGTTGLTGAADTTLVLARKPAGMILYGRGRDIVEVEEAVEFCHRTGCWRALGDAVAVHRSDIRKGILEALRGSTEPMGPRDISDAGELDHDSVRQRLAKMVEDGEVLRIARGKYLHPDQANQDAPPSQPLHRHNATEAEPVVIM